MEEAAANGGSRAYVFSFNLYRVPNGLENHGKPGNWKMKKSFSIPAKIM